MLATTNIVFDTVRGDEVLLLAGDHGLVGIEGKG